jgi:hypothetical protein
LRRRSKGPSGPRVFARIRRHKRGAAPADQGAGGIHTPGGRVGWGGGAARSRPPFPVAVLFHWQPRHGGGVAVVTAVYIPTLSGGQGVVYPLPALGTPAVPAPNAPRCRVKVGGGLPGPGRAALNGRPLSSRTREPRSAKSRRGGLFLGSPHGPSCRSVRDGPPFGSRPSEDQAGCASAGCHGRAR